MLTNIDKKLDIAFICNINQRVSQNESLDWGVIRYGDVGVRLADGSSFQPEIPDAEYVEKKLNEIDKMDNITEKALTYYLWGLRSQLFWDGNKRTSNIIANAILIKNGKGIITIHEKNIDEFNIILSEFYLSNNGDTLKEFLYEKCIKGMTIDKELEKKNKNACIAVNGMNNENKK
jgi:prophage maintenance system killer protein